MTGKNIGFEFDRSAGTTTAYASCANGATQTRTAMTGFTSGTDIVFTFVKKGTASVDFYVDGTYKCTITTNIPSSTNTGFFGQSISNRNTASSTIFNVGNYYWEKTFNSTK